MTNYTTDQAIVIPPAQSHRDVNPTQAKRNQARRDAEEMRDTLALNKALGFDFDTKFGEL